MKPAALRVSEYTEKETTACRSLWQEQYRVRTGRHRVRDGIMIGSMRLLMSSESEGIGIAFQRSAGMKPAILTVSCANS